MILKALELQGFKSFPDKTTLTFGAGITAVVGPNGSGKSNISDAIRWVLGEQSAKSLRGPKMESVIFDGTATRRGMGFAEVSLVIDNTSRTLAMDADDVRVTRRYYRSGESDYLLNRATVRLKDIQMLFMDTGLGRDGYSIIGQGRVGDIVSSKSEERREIFEEAAGIAKYRYRKNEAERRLQGAEENLLRLRDIVRELEERVGPLADQAQKARTFLTYAEEKKTLEIGVWLHAIERSRASLREITDRLELARTQYDSAEADIEKTEEEEEGAAEAIARLLSRADEIRRERASLEEKASEQERLAAVRQNDRAHHEENILRMREEIQKSHEGAEQLFAQESETVAARERMIGDIGELQKEEETLTGQMEGLAQSDEQATRQVEDLTKAAADLSVQAADWRVTAVTGENACAEITARLTALQSEYEQETKSAGKARDDRQKNAEAQNLCRERVQSLQNAAEGCEMRLNARREKMEVLHRNTDQLHVEAETVHRRVHILEEMERSMEGFTGSVKAVMKESERGALTGIHAPISRLLDSEPKTALAVETALGAASQNLVCDTQKDAKRAIAYLKETGGGRATFLPLDTVKGKAMDVAELPQRDGLVGLASQLVTCEERYRPIADNLLGRTAVAEDLDSAVAIAKGCRYRFRVVTLDGQVVNAGGSMTGGSSVKSAGLLSRRAEIERLRQKEGDLRKKEQQSGSELRAAEQSFAEARAQHSGTLAELSLAKEDLIRLETEEKTLLEQEELHNRQLRDKEEEQALLRSRTEEARKAVADAETQLKHIGQRQKEVDAQIADLTGGRRELQERREALAESLSACKLRQATLTAQIQAADASLEALRLRQEDAEGTRERLLRRIEALRGEIEKIEQDIAGRTQNAALLREREKEGEKSIEGLTAERLAKEAEQTALRRHIKEKTDERELCGREITRLEEKRDAAAREAEDREAQLQEEYHLTRQQALEQSQDISDIPAATRRLRELKNKIRQLGSVNVDAIEEYREVSERYEFLSAQVKDVETAKAELLTLIDDLTRQMRSLFTSRFDEINQQFGAVFRELFDGGQASLSLTDPGDVLSSGIEMQVQPPGKKILHLDALSGGEKALTAISLLFAILRVTPSPFCVLDEIEAALDDVNVERFAAFLRRMCDRTQFIVITHRRGTMEEADVLYGVTMQEKGVSKLLELQVDEVAQKLGIDKGKPTA